MKKLISVLVFLTLLFLPTWPILINASEDHDHKDKHNDKHHSDHKDEHEDEHHDEDENHQHDEHEEASSDHKDGDHESSAAVGADKGILEKSNAGFKLSPEAYKTMDLKFLKFKTKPFQIPNEALVRIKNDVTVFRLKDGWFQRVAPQKLSLGDEILINGAGFVRTVEIFLDQGASHSHSH